MNITQAKTAMQRLLGKKAMWRYSEQALRSEEREAVRATLPALSMAKQQAREAMNARRDELLKDPEYQRLKAAAADADRAHSEALGQVHHYRVTIGEDFGIGMHVLVEADNWQEAIDALKAKKVST